MNTIMVTGIKSISHQQQVSVMGLNGISAATVSQMPSQEVPVKRSTTASDARRSNKPIMEKRRRARINNCLNELKTLILDAMKKDPARHSKLEKADILEMTVKYLQNHQLNLQRQQAAMSQATEATLASKFKSGFAECANEVGRYPGLEPQVKRRLLQHLSGCISGVKQEQHVLPSPPSSPEQESSNNGYYLTNGAGNGVQLIPTKLPNGNIAFVLPQSVPSATTHLPMLVPIPQRTASTGSATSSHYERVREQSTSPTAYNAPPSPANSSYHEPMDVCMPTAHQNIPPHSLAQLYQQQQQQQQQRSYSPSQAPLSLVMKKTNFEQQMKDDEKPWRPW